MRIRSLAYVTAMTAGSLVPCVAFAASVAVATADLNIRSGPGPEHPVIGAIPNRGQATIIGCVQDSLWCQIAYRDRQGWAYARYLTTQLSGDPVVVAERPAVPTVVYRETVGATPAEVTGAIVDSLARTAATATQAIFPPPPVRTYVVSNPIDPVYLDREVAVGATLPETVELQTVPDYRYRYVYVNRQPVLVEPDTRRIVYVYR